MGLVELCVILIVIGVLLWVVTTYVPMDPTIKRIMVGVVVVVVILWIQSLFIGHVPDLRIHKVT